MKIQFVTPQKHEPCVRRNRNKHAELRVWESLTISLSSVSLIPPFYATDRQRLPPIPDSFILLFFFIFSFFIFNIQGRRQNGCRW